jgi:hypothetical protein
VVFDDPEFAPELDPEEQEQEEDDAAPRTAVALVAALLRRYRARQFELLAAIPDERLQLELALLAPLMDAEQEQEQQERARRRQADDEPPPRLPRVQFRLLAKQQQQKRACFSIPLEGVKVSSLGPLAEYVVPPLQQNRDEGTEDDSAADPAADTATIRSLALRASFDISASSSSSSSQQQPLRLSLSAPLWLRRAGLPPLALPPLPASAAARPPLADYASDAAARLSAHLTAQAPRAAKRYALVDALAAVLGSAPLEVVAASPAAEIATPPAAQGGGGGWGWSAVVSRGGGGGSSASSSSSQPPALTALFAVALEGQPLLLSVEMSARFPDEQPALRLTRALAPAGAAGGGGSSNNNSNRKALSPSAELAESGQATIAAGYPWSPRWPADEAAARIYNHLVDALVVVAVGGENKKQ